MPTASGYRQQSAESARVIACAAAAVAHVDESVPIDLTCKGSARMGTQLSRSRPHTERHRYGLPAAALIAALLSGCGDDEPAAPVAGETAAHVTANAASSAAEATPSEPVPETATGDTGTSDEPPGTASETPARPPTDAEIAAALASLPAEVPDELKPHIYALRQLQAGFDFGIGDKINEVDLDGSPLTDADLVHVAALPDLRILNLSNTKITDAGLAHIAKLDRLKFLYLFETPITDAGMEHLTGLLRLEVLCLDRTQITDVGLKSLEDLPRLERLHVHSRAPITDAGLESLKKHTRLFELRVGGPGVTEAGVEALRQALPGCNVVYDPGEEAPTD